MMQVIVAVTVMMEVIVAVNNPVMMQVLGRDEGRGALQRGRGRLATEVVSHQLAAL